MLHKLGYKHGILSGYKEKYFFPAVADYEPLYYESVGSNKYCGLFEYIFIYVFKV